MRLSAFLIIFSIFVSQQSYAEIDPSQAIGTSLTSVYIKIIKVSQEIKSKTPEALACETPFQVLNFYDYPSHEGRPIQIIDNCGTQLSEELGQKYAQPAQRIFDHLYRNSLLNQESDSIKIVQINASKVDDKNFEVTYKIMQEHGASNSLSLTCSSPVLQHIFSGQTASFPQMGDLKCQAL